MSGPARTPSPPPAVRAVHRPPDTPWPCRRGRSRAQPRTGRQAPGSAARPYRPSRKPSSPAPAPTGFLGDFPRGYCPVCDAAGDTRPCVKLAAMLYRRAAIRRARRCDRVADSGGAVAGACNTRRDRRVDRVRWCSRPMARPHEDPFHVVLKQDGGALTGTAGPDADRQYRINNGKVTRRRTPPR